MTEQDIIELVKKDAWRIEILRAVRDLDLHDWWIGAGFIRNMVWDHLHGYKKMTAPTDIDVIYFDTKNISEETEKKLEEKLLKALPHEPWSVKNQARMALKKGHTQYANAAEGLSRWVETATSMGVKLNKDNTLKLALPYGIDDVSNLIVRPTPFFMNNLTVFHERYQTKHWLEKWPKLLIEDTD